MAIFQRPHWFPVESSNFDDSFVLADKQPFQADPNATLKRRSDKAGIMAISSDVFLKDQQRFPDLFPSLAYKDVEDKIWATMLRGAGAALGTDPDYPRMLLAGIELASYPLFATIVLTAPGDQIVEPGGLRGNLVYNEGVVDKLLASRLHPNIPIFEKPLNR